MTTEFIDRPMNDRRASLGQYGLLVFGIAAVIAITVLTLAHA
jgi:hypothetical protein